MLLLPWLQYYPPPFPPFSPNPPHPSLSSLSHLHEGLDVKVVHRDVKASNVLLDEQWNAKLGDFALAKVIGHDQGPAATRVLGTFG